MTSFPLTKIHEIELSSICNLACVYCPHPNLGRAKAHMQWDILERTLEHVAHYCGIGTQGEIALTGIGEAILHPEFDRAVARVREVIGGRKLTLSTNGVAVDDAVVRTLARYNVRVYVSLHRPEVATPAAYRFKDAGLEVSLNHAFVDSSLDWAGQVDWHVTAPSHTCSYLAERWGVVRQDGSVVACCMDAHGVDPIGHVNDLVGSLSIRPIRLCESCNLKVPPQYAAVAA